MNILFNIPEHELYISGVIKSGEKISFRLVSDYCPDSAPHAFSIVIENPNNAVEIIAFSNKCIEEEEYIYAFVKNNLLVFQKENGISCETAFQSIEISSCDLDAEELSAILKNVYSRYQAESAQCLALQSRVNEAFRIAHEASRRIEIKSKSHVNNSTVTTLYEQQISLIKRITNALIP